MRYNSMMYILHGAIGICYRVHDDGKISENARSNLMLIIESLEDLVIQIRNEREK